jgi:transcriptional regulator with XRE-family HTH domain
MPSVPNIVDVDVGSKVRVMREAQRLTEEQVARRLEILVEEYKDLERGRKRFSPVQLKQLSSLLNTNIAVFFETVRFEGRRRVQFKLDFDHLSRNGSNTDRVTI